MVWVTHMKTTLDIDDHLLERAKRQAAAQGTTLRALVEEALRARLAPRSPNLTTPLDASTDSWTDRPDALSV